MNDRLRHPGGRIAEVPRRSPRGRSSRFAAYLLALLAALSAGLLTPHGALAARPIYTSIYDPLTFPGPGTELAFARTRAAGATFAEIQVYWAVVAPGGDTQPSIFDASDPADPAYRWQSIDEQVLAAKRHGLQPVLSITSSPPWAQGDPSIPNYEPNPSEFAAFALAAARRYSGSFDGLPRVRYWIAWDEPNFSAFLAPQFQGGRLVAATIYRNLLNAFALAVKSVHTDNEVIVSGLDPFAKSGTLQTVSSPLRFIGALLCLSSGSRPHATCRTQSHFDIWSYHPYTEGGPSDRAHVPGDLSLGDVPAFNGLIHKALAARRIVSSGQIQFWVTEFSWDSDPPHPKAVPQTLLTRWVAEAIYNMWRADVTVFTWFLLRDRPVAPSGLYYRGSSLARDKPKPSLAAFRFPFVAYSRGAAISVWGRTPGGQPGVVKVEQQSNGRWLQRASVHADLAGVFSATLPAAGAGGLRAQFPATGALSPAFSLQRPRDLIVAPFA